MRNMLYVILLVLLVTLFNGCRGIEPALFGQEREDYLKSIKPWRDYWRKDGSSEETKTKDWIECGGKPNGDFGADGSMERYNLLKSKLIECIQKKGYKIDRKY